tara:strand:+ start:74970 stop:75605 length:636 start_codon:yes stop_codon:yes gene_type:complete
MSSVRAGVAFAAIAGLVAGASGGVAEESFSLSMYGPTSVDGSSPFTLTIDVIGDSSFGTHLLGGQFGLSTGGHPQVSDIRWIPEEWSTVNDLGEYDGNGNLDHVIFGQFVVFTDLFDFLPGAGSEVGSLIGSFEVDFDDGLSSTYIEFNFTTDPERFALKAVDVDEVARTTQSLDSNSGNLSLNGFGILVPSPSAMALLGFGGLASTKRRR